MQTALTAVVWPSNEELSNTKLLGRPLWHWTLEAVRSLEPKHILLISKGRPQGVPADVQLTRRSQLAGEVARAEGKVLLLSAELPCLQPRSLKRLVSATRKDPRCLNLAGTTLCLTGRDWKMALVGISRRAGLTAVIQKLAPTPIQATDGDDLLVIRHLRDWATALAIFRRRKCEKLLASGVLIEDPSAVQIDPGVHIGRGTLVRGWVVIEGDTRIGPDCEIGSFSHIIDSVVGTGTILLDHCFIRASRIGKNAQLGPFTHLRPESNVGTKAKVGNFVELKKTTLGYGSKAPHLTYLGDANIGRGVNVGAGTITCNYDGKAKHLTVIGDGAFIGSDVQLVAPVRVGKGAYVAAGSCIVEDVPAESLALARSRQVVKPGWVRKNNAKTRKTKKD